MSDQVPVHFAQKFKGDIRLLSQQMTSRLADCVEDEPDAINGKQIKFNRLAATEMQRRTGRHADTPLVDQAHSARVGYMAEWEWADMIDRHDVNKMVQNPQSKYHKNAVSAANRNKDKVILAALLGNSHSIDEDDATSAIALPSAQKIVHGSAGLTLAKLKTVKQMLNAAEALEDQQIFMGITAKQETDLYGITEYVNADYNGSKPLADGELKPFLGIHFKRLELIGTDSNGNRACPAWVKPAIGFYAPEDMFSDIGTRRDKGLNTQVYVSQQMGAVRIEDEMVVEVACVES